MKDKNFSFQMCHFITCTISQKIITEHVFLQIPQQIKEIGEEEEEIGEGEVEKDQEEIWEVEMEGVMEGVTVEEEEDLAIPAADSTNQRQSWLSWLPLSSLQKNSRRKIQTRW